MILQAPPIRLPNDAALKAAVPAVLRAMATPGRINVIAREPSEWISTYPAEVITCRTADGSLLRLLCKYSGGRHRATDHRSGVAHEAEVYRRILHPLAASAPRYFGTYHDPGTGWTWLLLEQMDEAYPLDMAQHRIGEAAAWLGHFHAAAEVRLKQAPLGFLRRYDLAYYRKWASRTARFAEPLGDEYPWVADVCRRVREPFELLLSRPQTVVHGEFTVFNVLVCERSIRPVDWESAAVGAGEIDLITLIEGWPQRTMRRCIDAYRTARWPESGGPPDFDRVLDAAYVHLLLRGLGGDPKYTTVERTRWRFDELWLAGKRWKLV